GGAHDVAVDNFSFAPSTAMVPAGATVTWTNRDDVPHNIVSVERQFKSPVLDTDEQFSHRFDTPGRYEYFCSLHPKMTGQVVVGYRGATSNRVLSRCRAVGVCRRRLQLLADCSGQAVGTIGRRRDRDPRDERRPILLAEPGHGARRPRRRLAQL